MTSAAATKAAYQREASEAGHDLSKAEIRKTTNKLEPRRVSDAEKRFAAEVIGDDKMTAAGRRAFRKFMADDGKPNHRSQAMKSFAAKVAAHSRDGSQLGSTLSQLEVRQELAELRKNGATQRDEDYARAVYKGKKLSPAARREVNKFNRAAG
jgi:hypothetical protein